MEIPEKLKPSTVKFPDIDIKEACFRYQEFKWKGFIDFFDYVISAEKAKTWGIAGLDYKNIIGEVLFDGVPLDGERSDLTALFWIIKVNENEITLVFRDLHVM